MENYNSKPKSKSTPIRVGRHIVGKVSGDTFIKRVQASRHFLTKPPAIAFDIKSLLQAEQAGALRIKVVEKESGAIYQTSIEHIHRDGFELNRGFGRQIALPLDKWTRTCRGELEQLPLL